ncbi:MAG TPA: MurR/RpiR family transcriptional regulator [Caulobacteraceae bacterium]|nr:MurR/RpiR family transcriptional regulator [Caulobacteraceae bacterium]
MSDFEEAIRRDWKSFTPSEQKLGTYFLNHLAELPFETAASISKQVQVSPMTVGRYIRKLGYADLRDIKHELRAKPAAWAERQIASELFAPASLKAKIKALTDVYKLPHTPEWPRIVSMLASARTVQVASFQVGKYLGVGFATFLQNLRPGVFFAEGGDGSYAEVLLDPDPEGCLVLVDVRRYSRHFRLLAEEAAARGIRTIILTDVYCHWARAITDNVLMIETEIGVRSLSMVQLLMELLLAAVAAELEGADTRRDQVHALRQKFIGFVEGDAPRLQDDEA